MAHALVTGGAGFIGSHVIDSLLADGWTVTAFDNFDPFYDREVKERNIAPHRKHHAYELVEGDLRDADGMRAALRGQYDVLVHLAAKAGVRPSIEDPVSYQEVNVRGYTDGAVWARGDAKYLMRRVTALSISASSTAASLVHPCAITAKPSPAKK